MALIRVLQDILQGIVTHCYASGDKSRKLSDNKSHPAFYGRVAVRL